MTILVRGKHQKQGGLGQKGVKNGQKCKKNHKNEFLYQNLAKLQWTCQSKIAQNYSKIVESQKSKVESRRWTFSVNN